METNRIHLPDVVGKGYGTYWRHKGFFRVCKGSRRSKKSTTTALWFIVNMMKYRDANLLVVRKTYRTLKDSCFTQLKWAIHRLCVDRWWSVKESPLEMTYLPTGQKVYFRGMDDPLKITSIATEVGVLSWLWVEEAFEITREEDFDTLVESILGDCPEGLFKQVTLTFNPWNEKTWLKKRFFDVQGDPDILAITTTYQCNEWLSEADKAYFEDMRERNPRRYRVAGLGEWGVAEGLIYENWEERAFDFREVSARLGVQSAFGLDFGYTNDPSALFCGLVSKEEKTIWVFDEMYGKGMSNRKIHETISRMGYGKERIRADCAEPKSIDELRDLGLFRIRPARKGRDSILNGIQFIQDFHIVIHPRCVNFLMEIGNYTWDSDKFGNRINRPIDEFNHLMDAMRYGLEDVIMGPAFDFS